RMAPPAISIPRKDFSPTSDPNQHHLPRCLVVLIDGARTEEQALAAVQLLDPSLRAFVLRLPSDVSRFEEVNEFFAMEDPTRREMESQVDRRLMEQVAESQTGTIDSAAISAASDQQQQENGNDEKQPETEKSDQDATSVSPAKKARVDEASLAVKEDKEKEEKEADKTETKSAKRRGPSDKDEEEEKKKVEYVISCICGQKEDDGEEMIACDMCKVRWEHVDCIFPRTKKAPDGKYYCHVCNPRPTELTPQQARAYQDRVKEVKEKEKADKRKPREKRK
ncbi:hypothetical protein PMAYCL1PPCAC_16430, partial [Pristionchus mayeri]